MPSDGSTLLILITVTAGAKCYYESAFYQGRNWGRKLLSNPSTSSQLANCLAGVWRQVIWGRNPQSVPQAKAIPHYCLEKWGPSKCASKFGWLLFVINYVVTVRFPHALYFFPNSWASLTTNCCILFWYLYFFLLLFISCNQEQSFCFSPKCKWSWDTIFERPI